MSQEGGHDSDLYVLCHATAYVMYVILLLQWTEPLAVKLVPTSFPSTFKATRALNVMSRNDVRNRETRKRDLLFSRWSLVVSKLELRMRGSVRKDRHRDRHVATGQCSEKTLFNTQNGPCAKSKTLFR